jgi:fucose permease
VTEREATVGTESAMPRPERRIRRLLGVVGAVFFSAGMAQGTLGPILQDLAQQSNADPAEMGGMFTALMLSGFVGQSAAAICGKRVSAASFLALGMALNIAGYAGIALSSSFAMLLVCSAVSGLGFGVMLLTGNVAAAEASSRAGPVNLVNALFGVGAICGPLLVWMALRTVGSSLPALWGAPIAMMGALMLLLLQRPNAASEAGPESPAPVAPQGFRSVLGAPAIWLLGFFCMLEVSLEVGFSAWLPTLLERATDMPLAEGATVMSLFWLLLTASRLTAAWASRFLEPLQILRIAVALSTLGCVLLLGATLQGNRLLAALSVVLFAPGIGPILPTVLAIVRATIPNEPSFASG